MKKICTKISDLDITLIFVAIDKSMIKNPHTDKDLIKNRSWEFLIERINLVLKEKPDHCGMIISDSIEYTIEKRHREFVKILHEQSFHIDSRQFVETILFEPSDSSDFLQLADVCAYTLHRKLNCGDNTLYEIIENKIYEHDSVLRNSGLKIWPKN